MVAPQQHGHRDAAAVTSLTSGLRPLMSLLSPIALMLAVAVAPTAEQGIYAGVVVDLLHRLKDVRSVRVFVQETTEELTAAKLERLAEAGPKDDPPDALARARKEKGFELLIAANAGPTRVQAGRTWSLVAREPVELRCSGSNWEVARDVFIRFSRPVLVTPDRALVYVFVRDCISFGHDIVVMKRFGAAWKPVAGYQIAGAGE